MNSEEKEQVLDILLITVGGYWGRILRLVSYFSLTSRGALGRLPNTAESWFCQMKLDSVISP